MRKKTIIILTLLLSFISSKAHNIDSILLSTSDHEHDSSAIDSYYKTAEHYRKSDLNNSILFAQKGLEIARNNGDKKRVARGLYYTGKSYCEMGLYDEAISDLTEMQKVSEEINYHKGYIEAIVSIGTVFSFQGDKENSLALYKDALQYMNEKECYDKAFAIYQNIGLSFNHPKQKDSLFYYMNKARHILETEGDEKYSVGHIYLNMGSLYLNYNQPDSGEYYLHKALGHAKNMRTISRTALYSKLANFEASRNNNSKAYQYLDSCYQNATTDNNELSKRRYYMTKIRLDSLNKKYKSALNASIELRKINSSFNKINNSTHKEYYKLKLKEHEYENLKKENEIIKLKEKQTSSLIISLTICIILISTIAILYRKSHKTKKRSINDLSFANEKLKNHQEELYALNDKLSKQKNGLENALSKLEATQKQLVQSEKMASLGVMAGGISHEINNPLNYINGGLFILDKIRTDIEVTPEVAKQFEQSYKMVEEGLIQVHNVVKVLNQFVEEKPQKPKENDINTILSEVLKQLEFKINDDTKVETKISKIPLVHCDSNKIKQVFSQLIINAIDATNKTTDKKIRLQTHTTTIDDRLFVAVKVSNNGMPIDYENIDKIFDPFFTTKPPDKGYGLGLSIVYSIMKDLNGKILVNNIDSGVEFLALFPTEKPKLQASE